MPCTATKRVAAAALIALCSWPAVARAMSPRILQEPVLGLRLEAANSILETLPEGIRGTCVQFADNDSRAGRLWVFARTTDAETTYYVVAGYYKIINPDPGRLPYVLEGGGGGPQSD